MRIRGLKFFWIRGTLATLVASNGFSIDAPLAEAEKLLRQGKTDDGKRIITTYITSHENAAGYIGVGSLYARVKWWPDSVHYLDIATKRDPKNALAWYELGLAQHQNKDVVGAIDSLRHSLRISSTTAKTYMALGQILELAGDRYDARSNYSAALTKTGQSALLHQRLCWLLYRDNYFEDAIKHCQAAVKLAPQDDMAWAVLGKSLYENHEKTEAFSVFQKVLAARPRSELTYKARGIIYLNEKTYEQAAADLGKAFAIDETDDEAAIGLARSLFESGRYADALPIYIEACKLDRRYRYELLAKQREVSRKNKEDLASQYQEAFDKF
jgi:tetratricopeptide (TPR) repeat protein